MNTTITHQVTAANASEWEHQRFTAEASELGLLPHSWPVTLPTTLGNGRPFILQAAATAKAMYRQEFGCIDLVVFND